jgi:hypothetical protein
MNPVKEDALFIILSVHVCMPGDSQYSIMHISRNICTMVSSGKKDLKPSDISGIRSKGFVEKLVIVIGVNCQTQLKIGIVVSMFRKTVC